MRSYGGYVRVALWATLGVAFILGRPAAGQEPAAGPDQRVAALKQTLQSDMARLRTYEWIETTIVSIKGEEKSRTQKRCYYAADGALQKLPIEQAASPAPAQSGGRGGRLKQRIVESKKQDMQEYMTETVSLVHQYVPPNPQALDNARNAGRVALRPGAPGRASLEFTGVVKPGDVFTVELDTVANRITGLAVASYLDEPDDAVTLHVQFGTLADGTGYAAQSTLDATAKNIRVVVQNAGYRPLVP